MEYIETRNLLGRVGIILSCTPLRWSRARLKKVSSDSCRKTGFFQPKTALKKDFLPFIQVLKECCSQSFSWYKLFFRFILVRVVLFRNSLISYKTLITNNLRTYYVFQSSLNLISNISVVWKPDSFFAPCGPVFWHLFWRWCCEQ